jgi:elongation factor G
VLVTAPEGMVGAVLDELAARRAAVHGVVVEAGMAAVRATLRLSKTFGFVTALRSRTEGRGEAALTVAGFAPVA